MFRRSSTDLMADRILVVGGNAAGMTAASRAKRLDPSLSVRILEGGPRIAYSICGLPFAVAGRVRFEDLVLFTPETLRNERGIEALVNREAIEIQPPRLPLNRNTAPIAIMNSESEPSTGQYIGCGT